MWRQPCNLLYIGSLIGQTIHTKRWGKGLCNLVLAALNFCSTHALKCHHQPLAQIYNITVLTLCWKRAHKFYHNVTWPHPIGIIAELDLWPDPLGGEGKGSGLQGWGIRTSYSLGIWTGTSCDWDSWRVHGNISSAWSKRLAENSPNLHHDTWVTDMCGRGYIIENGSERCFF